jgi:hypothetical protein
MSLLVQIGEKKSLSFQSADIRGIDLVSYNTYGSSSGGGDGNVDGIDWNRVYVNITLNQDGRSTTICATTVKPLAQHLNYMSSGWDYCSNQQTSILYSGSGGEAGDVQIANARVDFGCVLNLRGDDSLVVEVRVQSDCINGNWTTDSYIEVDSIEGVGLQYTTPQFHTFAINGGESKFSHSIGDNCTAVSLQNISTNPTGDYSNSPWQNARVFSDRYNINDDWGQLWSKRTTMFQTDAVATERHQSFCLSTETTDNTQVQLDLFPSNNNTNENYLCYSTFFTNKKLVAKASKRAEKHAKKSVEKVVKG